MNFDKYFRVSSYGMIAISMLALTLAGGLHPGLALGFGALMILAWNLEGTKWQLSERVGLVVVLFSVPLFFIDWKYQRIIGEAPGRLGVTALAHLIVFLSAIKILQVKTDRDWVFIYLISFFELLLAAGLSFSPIFLVTLTLYLLCGLSTVIAFEIRKARRSVKPVETRLLVPPDSRVFKKLAEASSKRNIEASRLPVVSLALLLLIFILALPLFLVAPRAGGAAISRGGPGLANFIGFSENVTLGEVGTLKQNDDIVMRVRVESDQGGRLRDVKWRGIALDEFTGRGWKKSQEARSSEQKLSDRGFFRLGTTEAPELLTTQTVFLEPIDSAVLFAAPRAVAVQGDLPYVRVDPEGSIQSRPHDLDRIIYKVLSDIRHPSADVLRQDRRPSSASPERYLLLPTSIDPRIEDYTNTILVNAGARNRYDSARAIESHLRQDFGYTLEMKASGPDPLSDFLFNLRAGHCEYFSTAMAVMLRTHGIGTRVVNGFLPGEYNETAGAYTVRQSDAHSWVEVYFPDSNSWVPFDPTPAAGRTEPEHSGFVAQLGKYAEALELMWFQYVVGYDKQEQRSLASSVQDRVSEYRRMVSGALDSLSRRFPGIAGKAIFVVFLISVPLLIFLGARVIRLGWRRGLRISRTNQDPTRAAVEFYQRLTTLLAERGLMRLNDQTPLEFAVNTGSNEALLITRLYNRVRFGGRSLSTAEVREIDQALKNLETAS